MLVEDLKAYLRLNPDQDVSLDALGERFGVSRRHITRMFREGTGCSIGEFQQRVRLETACELLSETDLPIGEIAFRVGFDSRAALARAMRRADGRSPSEVRRRVARSIKNSGPFRRASKPPTPWPHLREFCVTVGGRCPASISLKHLADECVHGIRFHARDRVDWRTMGPSHDQKSASSAFLPRVREEAIPPRSLSTHKACRIRRCRRLPGPTATRAEFDAAGAARLGLRFRVSLLGAQSRDVDVRTRRGRCDLAAGTTRQTARRSPGRSGPKSGTVDARVEKRTGRDAVAVEILRSPRVSSSRFPMPP